MDVIVTRLSVVSGGAELAPQMAKFVTKLGHLSMRTIARTRTAIYNYRRNQLARTRNLKKPKQFDVEMERID